MEQLHLPPYAIKVRERDGRRQIWDDLRRRYVALTPEEWVRQHFVHYLSHHLGYPLTLMGNEVRLSVGGKVLRADTVVYDRRLQPMVIVEYKAPSVELTEEVFDQAAAYGQVLRVGCLMVSNGLRHVCLWLDRERQRYVLLEGLPDYKQLTEALPSE